MKDFSKTESNVTYTDCQKCIHTFGECEECSNCNYFTDCIIQNEIDEFELARERELSNFYDRLENEEFPL